MFFYIDVDGIYFGYLLFLFGVFVLVLFPFANLGSFRH